MIKWLEEKRIFATILTLLIAIEIFYFSSIRGSAISGPSIPFTSYAYHFTAFFLLSFFLLISLNGNRKINFGFFAFAIILSITYAMLDEFHQMFVPFRNPSIIDIFTDNLGIFFSSLFYLMYKK